MRRRRRRRRREKDEEEDDDDDDDDDEDDDEEEDDDDDDDDYTYCHGITSNETNHKIDPGVFFHPTLVTTLKRGKRERVMMI